MNRPRGALACAAVILVLAAIIPTIAAYDVSLRVVATVGTADPITITSVDPTAPTSSTLLKRTTATSKLSVSLKIDVNDTINHGTTEASSSSVATTAQDIVYIAIGYSCAICTDGQSPTFILFGIDGQSWATTAVDAGATPLSPKPFELDGAASGSDALSPATVTDFRCSNNGTASCTVALDIAAPDPVNFIDSDGTYMIYAATSTNRFQNYASNSDKWGGAARFFLVVSPGFVNIQQTKNVTAVFDDGLDGVDDSFFALTHIADPAAPYAAFFDFKVIVLSTDTLTTSSVTVPTCSFLDGPDPEITACPLTPALSLVATAVSASSPYEVTMRLSGYSALLPTSFGGYKFNFTIGSASKDVFFYLADLGAMVAAEMAKGESSPDDLLFDALDCMDRFQPDFDSAGLPVPLPANNENALTAIVAPCTVPRPAACVFCPDFSSTLIQRTPDGELPIWAPDPSNLDDYRAMPGMGNCLPAAAVVACAGKRDVGFGIDTVCNTSANNADPKKCFKSSTAGYRCGWCDKPGTAKGCRRTNEDGSSSFDGTCLGQDWRVPSSTPTGDGSSLVSQTVFAWRPQCASDTMQGEEPAQQCAQSADSIPPKSGPLKTRCAPCPPGNPKCDKFFYYEPTTHTTLEDCNGDVAVNNQNKNVSTAAATEEKDSPTGNAPASTGRRVRRRKAQQTTTRVTMLSARCDACAVNAWRVLATINNKPYDPDVRAFCANNNPFPPTPGAIGSSLNCQGAFDLSTSSAAVLRNNAQKASYGFQQYANAYILMRNVKSASDASTATSALKAAGGTAGVVPSAVLKEAAKTSASTALKQFASQCDRDMADYNDKLCQAIMTDVVAGVQARFGKDRKNAPKLLNITFADWTAKLQGYCTTIVCPNAKSLTGGKCAGQTCAFDSRSLFAQPPPLQPSAAARTVIPTAQFNVSFPTSSMPQADCLAIVASLPKNATNRNAVALSLLGAVQANQKPKWDSVAASKLAVPNFLLMLAGMSCSPTGTFGFLAQDFKIDDKNTAVATDFRDAVVATAGAGQLVVTILGKRYNASSVALGRTQTATVTPVAGGTKTTTGGSSTTTGPKFNPPSKTNKIGNSQVNKANSKQTKVKFGLNKTACDNLKANRPTEFRTLIADTVHVAIVAYGGSKTGNKMPAEGQIEAVATADATRCASVEQDLLLYDSTGADAITAAALQDALALAIKTGGTGFALVVDGVTYAIDPTVGPTTATSAAAAAAPSALSLALALAAAFLAARLRF